MKVSPFPSYSNKKNPNIPGIRDGQVFSVVEVRTWRKDGYATYIVCTLLELHRHVSDPSDSSLVKAYMPGIAAGLFDFERTTILRETISIVVKAYHTDKNRLANTPVCLQITFGLDY